MSNHAARHVERPVVLVTGATGFLGSEIVKRLSDADHWRACSLREAFSEAGIDGDARAPTPEDLARLTQRVHAVVHCGGNASIRNSLEDPRRDLHATLGPAYSWLEYLRRLDRKVPFVFLSSSAVYGAALAPSSEDASPTPVSPYGLHKAMAEELIRYYGRVHGITSAILRPFSVIGPGQRKQLIWDALCRFSRGESHFEGGGQNLRDFIDVRDVAAFVRFALSAASREAPTFNLSTGIGTTVRDAMLKLAAHYGLPSEPSFGDRQFAGDPKVLIGINDAAKSLGWAPTIDLDTSLAEITRWFRGLPSA